jgi:hypothetical protein
MSTDRVELARFAHVEPPAELDAWVRTRLRAAIAEQAPDAAIAAAPRSMAAEQPSSLPRDPSRARPVAVQVPLVERLALAVGAVACGVQASAFLLRMVWTALSLGR